MAGGAVIAPTSNSGRTPPPKPPPATFYVVLLTTLACIGGLLFGYDTGVTSSVMLFLPDNPGMKPLTTVWQEIIVSITPGVAAIGALAAGKTSDSFGRRPVILVASGVFFVGAIVCAAAPERYTLLVGRALLGIAIGFASMIIPVYIGEAAPSYMRGTLITIYQIMIASGFILANAVAAGFAHIDPTNIGWRLMFGFAAIPSAIQLVGFLFLKDTPRYLYKSGQKEMCEVVLNKIYGNDKEWVEYDLSEIKDATEEENAAHKAYEHTTVVARIFKTPHVLRALAVGCSMQMFQQLIGINTILYYTSKIIQSAGVEDNITTIWISCGISAVQAVSTLIPMKLIEKLGRRPILLISIIAVIVTLCLMGGTFVLINKDSVVIDHSRDLDGINSTSTNYYDFCIHMNNCDSCVTASECGFCYPTGDEAIGQCLPLNEEDEGRSTTGFCTGGQMFNQTIPYVIKTTCKTKYTILPIIVMVFYLIAFSFGMGPMPWVFNAEIYPLWARSTCVSLATFTNWTFNLLIALTFLSLGEAITKYGAFFLYAGFATVGLIVFYFFVPETKGMSIEEIENLFKTKRERELATPDSYELKASEKK
ncbi:hypothetical protein PFISCL1PPCAC_22637 [Pristionchus fissidentatus]|uniref:Major facilitator superfamily (MFS) profile domain-containing protein n=1 Tax=Pristionchus fissidentatus TaxID=1538716 RepID=A0AAV5WI67_9BILA|nr:hypothetical protein PFISCL1PPCAC_22637 [Pristionchus fissidentatus]